MSNEAPYGSVCRQHSSTPAVWTCHRCGSFFCTQCERRTRPDAAPICPACWDLRAEKVKPNEIQSKTRLHTLGFGLGIAAIFPIPALQIAALVINIIALAKTKEPEQIAVRWKPIVGLCCTGVGLLIDLAFVVFAIAS